MTYHRGKVKRDVINLLQDAIKELDASGFGHAPTLAQLESALQLTKSAEQLVRVMFTDVGLKLGPRRTPDAPIFNVMHKGEFFGTITVTGGIVTNYTGPLENIVYIGQKW